MQKQILLQMVEQSRKDCFRILEDINTDNVDFRLTEETASVGFIYRHIGEATNLMAQFFGYETDVEGTTMGQTDTGKDYDLETSRMLVEDGYTKLEKLVNETSENEWLEEIETTWFGKLSRINLLAITLYHNSHHCGQIASAIVKGKKH
ncbi:DinB family protein [Aliifodinibius salicampi]|uniref:DinB family protein n=1 Tax=Fodinibius salicampi TaxID=1920655 RepID=A0ABT3Q1D0_9BACT|nr:DinB family protein [Fodinibius salicampi]MCW9713914.1 DinB family protein [Fodinibius salicampi]